MRNTFAALLLCFGACTGTEADPDPGKSWRFAIAHQDCAPWDGAAVSVLLSDSAVEPPTPPYLRLSAYIPMPDGKARADVAVSGVGGMGAGWCEPGKDCVPAEAGWVEFTPSQERLAGRYDLTLHDGRRLSGSFRATIRTIRQVLCG